MSVPSGFKAPGDRASSIALEIRSVAFLCLQQESSRRLCQLGALVWAGHAACFFSVPTCPLREPLVTYTGQVWDRTGYNCVT